jgi:hypothetical protein
LYELNGEQHKLEWVPGGFDRPIAQVIEAIGGRRRGTSQRVGRSRPRDAHPSEFTANVTKARTFSD